MKIIPLSEGSFTVDKTKQFVPFDETSDSIAARNRGSLLVEVQPFVVITSRDTILLDTGLGFEVDGHSQLLGNLGKAGVDPAGITKVLLSHLHKDHSGGACTEREGLGSRLTIPNATYYVQEDELRFAFEKGKPSFIPEELVGLQNNPRVHLLEKKGTIDGYIRHEVTGAHSPFHQVFWIEDEGSKVFFGADDAPQLHQMKHKFAAKYDHDGKKAMQLRQQWWEQGEKENWTFLFYHDVKTPAWPARQN